MEEAGVAELAIDLIGADVVEDFSVVVFVPSCAGGFEKIEGADDVGVEEIAGVFDGAIDVGFGGEVGDVGGIEVLDSLGCGIGVGEVDAGEAVVGEVGDGLEGERVSGVGEGVDVHELDIGHLGDVFEEEISANEAATAGH